MNYMAQFRELYFQRGAGGHFLASKCLWTSGDTMEIDNRNEYFGNMIKVTKHTDNAVFGPYKKFDIKTETNKILPVIEKTMSETVTGQPERVRLFHKLKKFYDDGLTDYLDLIDGIFNGIEAFKYLDQPTWEVIEDYFIQCKDYYYRMFENNNWSSDSISHKHPHAMVSSKLVLPTNMKTMAIEVDSVTDVYVRLLADMKGDELQEPSFYETSHEDWHNKSARLSDETISYRKIFFDNDENEIKRLYTFFDNLEYFEENRTNITKVFREYHNSNIQTLKTQSVYVPKEIHDIF